MAQTLSNGELLAAAERQFDVLVTTDQNLTYQQNLVGRRIVILVLPTTSWPRLKKVSAKILDVLNEMQDGSYYEFPADLP